MITQQLIKKRIHEAVPRILQKYPMLKKILHTIKKHNGIALLVGGGVRDIILNKTFSDLDFEVYKIDLETLKNILETYTHVHLVGKSFGVLKVDGMPADWSLPRTDSSGRKPEVTTNPYLSYTQAFKRRDLTMNAMGINLHTLELIDPYNGIHSLQQKTLQAPDPVFFKEDPLRLLRVMQFSARFAMTVSDELSEICRTIDISNISLERKEDEFKKLFTKSPQPSQGLAWIESIDQWNNVLPQSTNKTFIYKTIDTIAQTSGITDQQKVECSWATLLYETGIKKQSIKALELEAEKYVRSKKLQKAAATLAWHMCHQPEESSHATAAHVAHTLAPHATLLQLITIMKIMHPKQADALYTSAQQVHVLEKPISPLITGKDLMHLVQGQALGKALDQAYQMQLNENITSKQKLLAAITKKLKTT